MTFQWMTACVQFSVCVQTAKTVKPEDLDDIKGHKINLHDFKLSGKTLKEIFLLSK